MKFNWVTATAAAAISLGFVMFIPIIFLIAGEEYTLAGIVTFVMLACIFVGVGLVGDMIE